MIPDEALAALDEAPCNETKNINLEIVLPNVAMVSNEEAMDEEDLVQECLDLPDAAGEIEIHGNDDEPKAAFFQHHLQLQVKSKRNKLAWSNAVSCFFFFSLLDNKNTAG